ncbi:hypothetical protein M513_10028, partial [Trichuris suis]
MQNSFTQFNDLGLSRFDASSPQNLSCKPKASYFQSIFAPRGPTFPSLTGVNASSTSLSFPRTDFANVYTTPNAPAVLSDRVRHPAEDGQSRKSFGDFFTSALQELCTNIRRSLAEAGNVEQLADRFCVGLLQLFGKDSNLNLFTLDVDFDSDYELLHGFLKHNGVILNCADQLMRGLDVKFELSVEPTSADVVDLKPSYWKAARYERPVQSNCLNFNGFTSYEAYFFLFFWHVTKAKIAFVNEDSFSNAYISLLDDYLEHFLSVRSLVLALGPPVTGGYRAFLGGSPAFSNASLVSPHGLLNLSFYSNALESSGRPSGRVAYTELSWKATVFFNLLCDVWMCSPSGLQSAGIAPYKAFDICVITLLVRHVLQRLYKVVYGMQPMSDVLEFSGDTGAFEAGVLTRIFNFIQTLFQSWVSSSSFHYLLQLWLTAIQPWKYEDGKNGFGCREYTDKWASFLLKHRMVYKHFFWLTLKHFTYFKFTTARYVNMMHSVCKVYNNPAFIQVLKEHEMRTLMHASPGALADAIPMEEFFFGKQTQVTVRALLLNILRTERYLELQMQRSKSSRSRRSWWEVIVDFFSIDFDNDVDEARRMLVKLRFCRQTLSNLFQMDPTGLESLLSNEQQDDETDSLPDSILDQTGRLRLSPLGKEQVFNRFRQYPISRYPLAPSDLLPLRSDEFEFLFRLQRTVSAWLNAHFGEHFTRAYNTRGPVGWLAKCVLESPSEVTMRNTPVLTRHVDNLPVRISLRRFASVRTMGTIVVVGCLFSYFGVRRFMDFYVILYSVIIILLIMAFRNL